MYNEMSFLFSNNIKNGQNFNINRVRSNGTVNLSNKSTLYENINSATTYTVYKDKKFFSNNPGQIKNYIKQSIYDRNSDNTNPYIALLKDPEFQKGAKRLKPGYFTYLRDLGVYPINRLIILRRFREGVAVFDDLNRIASEPIATVIGWVKEDSDIFNLSFNEEWSTQTKFLHEIIYDILQNEFKVGGADKIIPQPGWTQGLLFGFLSKMGLTDSGSAYDIPFGDPNLLREAAYRDYEKQGLMSKMDITFETVYEQKYIGDFDPALAMLDIIRNLTDMGTSNTRYVLNQKSTIINDLFNAVQGKGNDLEAWGKVIKEIITAFISAIDATFEGLFGKGSNENAKKAINGDGTTPNEKNEYSAYDAYIKAKQDQIEANKKEIDKIDKIDVNKRTTTQTDRKNTLLANNVTLNNDIKYAEDAKKKAQNKKQDKAQKKEDSISKDTTLSSFSQKNALVSQFKFLDFNNDIGSFLKSVLAATFAKHRWPIRGSIGAMTGLPTAPWHITIGNPWNPIISAGNMIVHEVSVSAKGEMYFNDMPKEVTAKISLKFGRNLGKQEIQNIFNNGYRRVYSKKAPSTNKSKNSNTVSNTSKTDINGSANIISENGSATGSSTIN